MSTLSQQNLTKFAVAVSLAISVFGCVQSFANIPYRLGEAEKRMTAIENQSAIERDLLVRIEERVIWLQKNAKTIVQ